MEATRHHAFFYALSVLLFLTGLGRSEERQKPVSFNFQVRPILALNCYQCHGPDEKQRKADLRLDLREAAVASMALLPGAPDESELIKRLFTTDSEEVMPPLDSHRTLSENDKAVLRRWIQEGAPYEKHWSFLPVVSPAVPDLSSNESGKLQPIDAFVRQRLQEEQLKPAEETSREHWLRRVSFDLNGLPPTLAELDAFAMDKSTSAYETVLDRLLGSEAFGERMASVWLDAARYADTYGRHEDAVSPVWPYRDWVISAFNRNLPYDQFILQQTAGDHLPGATQDQIIATAFNRLVPQSNEAGSNEEEFRQEHVADRIKTNATAILGLTLECARCHDHKYDPLSQREYYQMAAFFNNIDELGLFSRQTAAVPAPSLLLLDEVEVKRDKDLKAEIAATEKEFFDLSVNSKPGYLEWLKTHDLPTVPVPIAHYPFEEAGSSRRSARKSMDDVLHPGQFTGKIRQTVETELGKKGYSLHFSNDFFCTFDRMGSFRRSDPFSFSFWLKPGEKQERAVVLHCSRGGLDAASRGYEVLLNDLRPEFALCHFAPGNSIRVRSRAMLPLNEWSHLVFSYDGSSKARGLKIYLNGKAVELETMEDNLYRDILYRAEWGDFNSAKLQDNVGDKVSLTLGLRRNDRAIRNASYDELMIFDKALTSCEASAIFDPKPTVEPSMLAGLWQSLAGREVNPSLADEWYATWLRDVDETGRGLLEKLHQLRTAQDDLVNDVGEIMVMQEMHPRRPTYLLHRGQFDQPGEEVFPATPEVILPMRDDLPRNRLGLAKWYVDRKNPLTARVAVNRLWQIFFGRGIVGTSEDFGIQGELPTHPELLDWLAADFMDHGWDVKRTCRMIALSATYRQSSLPSDAKLLRDDPENRLLARGPRRRLDAEMVRDNALALSGLLVTQFGGAPVRPYQPDKLYEDSGIQDRYTQDRGAALYRRSIYTFWKRTMPPPGMTIFDAPSREVCRARRETTSTPMQALVLLNSPEYLQACRVLAEKLVKAHPDDDDARVRDAFRHFTSRLPLDTELEVLKRQLREERQHFQANPDEAQDLLKRNGEAPVDKTLNLVEVATTTLLARVLIGSNEAIILP